MNLIKCSAKAMQLCPDAKICCTQRHPAEFAEGSECHKFNEEVESLYTNADHIRSMSDEELASYLIENAWDCHLCSEPFRLDNEPLLRGEKCDEKCVAHCLEWLAEPYKEKEE